jgi:hypothetical protein
MSELSKRSTVYFDPAIHQALRLKAASTHLSVFELVDEAVRLPSTQEPKVALNFRVRIVKEPGKAFVASSMKSLKIN